MRAVDVCTHLHFLTNSEHFIGVDHVLSLRLELGDVQKARGALLQVDESTVGDNALNSAWQEGVGV
eukprot:15866-Heterococcus_DN1.PRE.3